jgi:nitroreductase
MNDRFEALASLLNERYSCRAYRPEPVPRETIARIVALAQRTPSWCNAQPWQVVIAGHDATARLRERLLEHVRTHQPKPDYVWPLEYRGIYQQRRRECGFQLYQAVGVQRGDRAAGERQQRENFRFFGAPHVAIVSSDAPLGTYGAVDCGAYASNFVLAARALGIAAIAQAALAAYPDFWRAELGLAADRHIVCGISFGYEDAGHAANSYRTSRAEVDSAVTWLD